MEENSHLRYGIFGFHSFKLQELLLTVLKAVTFILVNNEITHCILMKQEDVYSFC
jgi:hypothetical protein